VPSSLAIVSRLRCAGHPRVIPTATAIGPVHALA
jgi:hypothetical protein